MRKKYLIIFTVICFFTLFIWLNCNVFNNKGNSINLNNQGVLDDSDFIKATVSNFGVEFADYVLSKWPNPQNISGSWEYNAGIVLFGVNKIYEKAQDVKYLNYITDYLDCFIDSNGNINWSSTHNLDLIQPGILLYTAYEKTAKEKYKIAAANIRERFDSFPKNAEGGFWHKSSYPNEMWIDGIYMAEPFITRYGYNFGDQDFCYNTAAFQSLLIASHAKNSQINLLYHGWDQDRNAGWANPITGLSTEFWSRGMGWYVMALVDILEYLPVNHPDYNSLLILLQDIALGLKNCQDHATGLWYQVLDKGYLSDNWHESSGTGMFVYALKKAVTLGLIDISYLSVAELGWEGLKTKIVRNSSGQPVINDAVEGMGVQTNYANYVNKAGLSNSSHGLCAIMLAASQMEY